MKEIIMRNSLLLTALFLSTAAPAAADCVAFLASPKVVLFAEDDGRTRYQAVRTEDVVLMPAINCGFKGGIGIPVKIKEGTQICKVATCLQKDFNVNAKSGLTKFLMKGTDGSFVTAWARAEELMDFTYHFPDPGEQSASENWAYINHGLELKLDRLRNVNFKPPEIENQRTFTADFDKTWSSLVETLSDQKWQVESIDRASGLVTTKPAIDSGGESMACATKFDEAHKTWLNVFVKKVETGTRVKVNATFHALREDQVITCYSNGTVEKALFDGIQKTLAGQ